MKQQVFVRLAIAAALLLGGGWSLAVAANAEDYPSAGITMLRTTCMQRKDIPKTAMVAYCDCYVGLVQKNISWHDWMLVDAAVSTKGISGLDAEEKAILGKGLQATFYCSQKTVR